MQQSLRLAPSKLSLMDQPQQASDNSRQEPRTCQRIGAEKCNAGKPSPRYDQSLGD